MPQADSPQRDAAVRIVRRLREAGHTAYFAGGCVRDRLLGLPPKDYDVATAAEPHTVRKLFPRSNAVGATFGVVLVYTGPNANSARRVTTEVATFRADGRYTDGRRPDNVTFTDAEHDAQRRDFTCNGLFETPLQDERPDPLADADGVIDFVGGRADLDAGVLRAIGDPSARFGEDYLRMIRAVRFAARLGFTIEPATAGAIRQHAPKLSAIARERIGDEVQRMIGETTIEQAADAAEHLESFGLTHEVFRPDPLGHNRPGALRRLPASADYPTRLATWRCFDDPNLLRQKLSLSNDHATALRDLRRLRERLPNLLDQRVANRKRTYAHLRFPDALTVHRALQPDADLPQRVAADRDTLAADGVGLAPPPLLTGDNLIDAGHRPGPHFKHLLDHAYDAQLEGRVTTQAQALALALTLAQDAPAPPTRVR